MAVLSQDEPLTNRPVNDPRDFAKPIKVIVLPQDVPSTFDRHLIELENQVQRLMEAHLAPTQPTQVNKITTSCEICSAPHDTQYCMEDPEQAFVECASSRTNKAEGSNGMMYAQISSGLAPQCFKMFEHISSSLGLHCQKTFKQISSNLVSQMSQRRLLASLQAPFLKEKKGVLFSALYLQQKRNLLILDHSYQQVSYFFHARSVVKWINVDQLIGKENLLLDLQKLQKNPIFLISVDIRQNTNFVRAFTTSANVPSIYIQLFWNTLTHDAKTGVYSFQVDEHWLIKCHSCRLSSPIRVTSSTPMILEVSQAYGQAHVNRVAIREPAP
ncbi:hypothetical protein Tco_0698018 [Tanacetum coccineum]